MKMNFKETALLLGLSMTVPATSIAQDKVEASVGADLVSGYIWRGQDLGGVSIQPSLSVAYKGFSLGAWGSAGIESADTKELDLTLGWLREAANPSVSALMATLHTAIDQHQAAIVSGTESWTTLCGHEVVRVSDEG